MAATQASLEAALDVVWTARRFKEQLFEENLFLDKVKKTQKFTQGKEARVPIHVQRNGGFTSLPAGGGTLNAAGQQGYAAANFKLTHHHQQVALQGDVLDVTEDSKGSIVTAADEEITRALNDMNRQFTRMSYMDGTALIAQSAASSTSNNLDIGTASGKVAIERGWLFEGQPIDVGTKANATSALSNSIIEAVDDVNFGLTLSSGNFTSEASTLFVSQHGARVGEVSNEMNGIQNIISATTTLGGVSPASQRQWKATVDSTTTTLTVASLLTAQRKIRQKQGKAPTFFLTGLLQQQRFYELLEQQVQFGSDKGLEAGNDGVAKWNGMEIFGDPDCPDNLLAMGHWEHFFMVQQDDPYWQNKHTGGEKLAWIQGTDSYGGKLTWRANIAVDRRNDLFLFNALT